MYVFLEEYWEGVKRVSPHALVSLDGTCLCGVSSHWQALNVLGMTDGIPWTALNGNGSSDYSLIQWRVV